MQKRGGKIETKSHTQGKVLPEASLLDSAAFHAAGVSLADEEAVVQHPVSNTRTKFQITSKASYRLHNHPYKLGLIVG